MLEIEANLLSLSTVSAEEENMLPISSSVSGAVSDASEAEIFFFKD